MKRDPSPKDPLNLAKQPKGGWQYVQAETNWNVQGKNGEWSENFWATAMRIRKHRIGNNLPHPGYEECQADLLTHNRKRLGLSSADTVYPQTANSEFKEKRNRCRTCGQKREKTRTAKL